VKLAPVVGLLVGFPQVLVALWAAFVTGGLVAVVLLLLRKKGRKDAIPFGPFLSLGAVAALLAGEELISFAETVSRRLGDVLM
jgi:leader peptidase (prepilin peptidase)/N-methyltransferase